MIKSLFPRLAALTLGLSAAHASAGSPVEEAVASEASRYEPPSIRPEDIRPGVTKQFRFTKSQIFPGTVRDVTA
jgi:hypothetical protein